MFRFFFLFVSVFALNAATAQTISRDSMATTLDRLTLVMETYHPNAYHYTDSLALSDLRRELTQNLPAEVDSLTAQRTFHRYVCAFGDGHTRVYGNAIGNAYRAAQIFPFELRHETNGWTIYRDSRPAAATELTGAIVQSINGVAMEQLTAEMRAYASRETESLDNHLLGRNFARYYWLAFGNASSFTVELSNGQSLSVAAVTPQTRRAALPQLPERARTTVTFPQPRTALLTITDFSGTVKTFKREMETAFAKINASEAEVLLLDLRDHDGGDARMGEELARYLSTVPVRSFAYSEYRLTESFQRAFKNTYLPGALGKLLPIIKRVHPIVRGAFVGELGTNNRVDYRAKQPHAAKKRFHGRVVLLMGEDTFSAGTCFAALFKDYRLGTIVGRESGNLANFHADALIGMSLPLGSRVDISTSYLVRPSGDEAVAPVQPDVWVPVGEEVLEAAMKVARSSRFAQGTVSIEK